MPLIGTLTRILWILAVFWLVFLCFNRSFPNITEWNLSLVLFALAGLVAADFIHIILDYF
jgi:hypothetical protein